MSQKTLESEALIKENDQEKQSQKLVLMSNINEDKGDEIQNIMNDMLSTIEVSLLKKKKRNSNKGGY
jgi:citrate lyase gamma subunit